MRACVCACVRVCLCALPSLPVSACITVNMSSPTPPHPGPPANEFNVQAAKCDSTDRVSHKVSPP